MELKQIETLVKQINSIDSDDEKLDFIISHKEVFMVYLDNDCTQISIRPEEMEIDYEDLSPNMQDRLYIHSFNEWAGDEELVFLLFEKLGVLAEGV